VPNKKDIQDRNQTSRTEHKHANRGGGARTLETAGKVANVHDGGVDKKVKNWGHSGFWGGGYTELLSPKKTTRGSPLYRLNVPIGFGEHQNAPRGDRSEKRGELMV